MKLWKRDRDLGEEWRHVRRPTERYESSSIHGLEHADNFVTGAIPRNRITAQQSPRGIDVTRVRLERFERLAFWVVC